MPKSKPCGCKSKKKGLKATKRNLKRKPMKLGKTKKIKKY